MRIVFVILLGICAIHDLRSKTIPVLWIWFSLGVGGIYRLTMIISGKGSINEGLFCLIPGVILLVFSYLGRQVGDGDGWLILSVGVFMEWISLIQVLFYSFLVAGMFSLGCLIMRNKTQKERIPFVPFLFLGMLVFIMRDLV